MTFFLDISTISNEFIIIVFSFYLQETSLTPCGYRARFQSNPPNVKYDVSSLHLVPRGAALPYWCWSAFPVAVLCGFWIWWWWCINRDVSDVGTRNSVSYNVRTWPIDSSSWNSPFASVKFLPYRSLTGM